MKASEPSIKELLNFPRVVARGFYRRKNYIPLSLSHQRNQKIYDSRRKEIITISIRDIIDRGTMQQIFIKEDYDLSRLGRYRELMTVYEKILKSQKKPLIVDLGANSGLASLYFSRIFPNCIIYAIEPDKNNFEFAKSRLSGIHNVEIINAGISCEDGMGFISNPSTTNSAFRTEMSAEGTLHMISMNTLLDTIRADDEVPFIVKIDIEGFESNLFSKSTEWVDSFPLLIIELHDWMLPEEANSKNFLKCISGFQRDFVYRSENVFSIKNNLLG